MLLTEDDHVIETLSAYGSHKALSVGILPGRPRCCEHLVDADAAHSTAKLVSVDAIAIADHVLGRSVFGKCLDDLLGGPSRAGMLGDVEVKKTASVVGQDEEDVKHAKVAVGTVKKSIEASDPTWLSRKVRHDCEGGFRVRGGIRRETSRSEITMPSLRSSP
jgi:hypothetical protein